MPKVLAAVFSAATTLGANAATAAASLGASGPAAEAIGETVAITASVAQIVAGATLLADLLKSPTPEGQRLTVRQAIPARMRGVGVARVGGPFLLDAANGKNDLYRVIAVVDGPVSNISRYYLGQDRAFLLDGDVVVKMPNGGYSGNSCSIDTAFGVTGVSSFPAIVTSSAGLWTAGDTGTGIFMIGLRAYGGSLENFTTCFPRGKPSPNIVGELCVAYDWRDDTQSQTDPTTWKNTANPVVGLVHELWCFRGYDWTLDFLPALDILTAEANYCDAATPYLNVFTQTRIYSTPGQNFIVLDPAGPIPANGTTVFVGGQTFAVTANDGPVTIADYTGTKIVLSGTLIAGVPLQFPIRWQANAESPVSEPTYACGGRWNADEPEKDTAKKFVESMDGWYQRRGSDGAVVVRCGHYYAPTVNIGPDEIIDFTVDDYASDGKVINQLLPAVVHPAWDYTQVDTTPVQDEDDIAINGLSNQPFKPDFVSSNGQVMRLANRKLAKLLQPVQSLTLKRSGIRALGERYINVDFGGELPTVTYEVCAKATITNQGMAVRLAVRQVDPDTIDAYDCYTQEGNGPAATAPAVTSNLAPDPPTITAAATYTAPIASGGSAPEGEFLSITVEPPAALSTRTDLTWVVQWQVSGASSWSPEQRFTMQPAGTITLTNIGPAPTNAELVVEAAYFTGGGQFSGWSSPLSVARGLETEGGLGLDTESGQHLAQDP